MATVIELLSNAIDGGHLYFAGRLSVICMANHDAVLFESNPGIPEIPRVFGRLIAGMTAFERIGS